MEAQIPEIFLIKIFILQLHHRMCKILPDNLLGHPKIFKHLAHFSDFAIILEAVREVRKTQELCSKIR